MFNNTIVSFLKFLMLHSQSLLNIRADQVGPLFNVDFLKTLNLSVKAFIRSLGLKFCTQYQLSITFVSCNCAHNHLITLHVKHCVTNATLCELL